MPELSLAVVQTLFAVAAGMGFLLAGLLSRNREKPGATALMVGNIGVGCWSLIQLSITIAIDTFDNTPLAVGLNRLLFPVVTITLVAVFVFALEYTGRERYVNRKTLAVLALYPLAVTAVVVVNPDGVFYADFAAVVEGMGEDTAYLQGPAFFAHTLVGYTLTAGVFLMILELLFRSGRPLYRGQATALLLALVIPFSFNVVTITGNVGFDLTVVGFILSSGLFTVAILHYDLINVTPVARQKVVENVRDGMFVVDTEGTVLDSNPAFRSLISIDRDSLAGTTVADLFQELPGILEAYEELTAPVSMDEQRENELTRERQVTYGGRYLNVQSTPIYDDRDRHVGWLFLTHDVTALVQRERDLEGQIEKLDQFAGIVSHDLRNPLNVARGYVQQARATDEMAHLDKTEEAMERMETIITEALALAREGEDVTEPETVSLESVASDAWKNVETGGASITVADVLLLADGRRLQRLLENLFRNSIEHGIDGDGHQASDHTVSVGSEESSFDELLIYIEDNGVGIPEDRREDVFEGGYTTNTGGTGLGLAIVEQIANAHGWTVTVTQSDSGGARFELHNVAKPV